MTSEHHTDIDINDIISKIGLRGGKTKGNYTEYYCPIHDNESPDLCVYADDFVCYHDGDRSGGGAISFLMHIKQYNSVTRAVEWLQENFPEKTWDNIDQETIEKRKKVREILNKATDLMHSNLKQEQRELYKFIKKDRDFDEHTMKETRIGFMSKEVIETLKKRYKKEDLINSGLFYEKDNDLICQMYRRIVFPYRRGEQTWYMIGRKPHDYKGPEKYQEILSNSDAKYKKLNEKNTLNRHIVYEWHEDTENSDTVLITEGVTDAISAHKAGYNVSSPVTTKYSDKDIEKVCQRVQNFENVYIIMDGDEEGWKGAKKTAQEMAENGVEAALVKLEEGDLDDWTTENHYNIKELLSDSEYYFDLLYREIEEASRRKVGEKKKKLWSAIRSWDEDQRTLIFSEMPGSKRDNRKGFKKWLEKKKEEEKKRKKSQLQKNIEKQKDDSNEEESSSEITSKLEVGSKKLALNPSIPIEVNQLKATSVEKETNSAGVIDATPRFKVFDVQFDEGEDQPTYHLLTEPYKNIHLGKNLLPVKRADLMKDKYFESEYFKKKFQKIRSENEDFSKTYKEWMKSCQDQYLELSDKLSNGSRDKIDGLTNDEILQTVREYQISGYHTDSKLRVIMYPQIIQHDKTKVNPERVAKYQPHSQMWTNTKVGKSSTAPRIGRKIDDATIAGLVGYADTDGKQEGVLNGLKNSVWIDEFNFGASSNQLNDKLLSVMETGKFEQTKAGRRIMTKFYGSINYMANPKESNASFDSQGLPNEEDVTRYNEGEETSLELISKFEELIQFLGYNIEAMGSRFGVILFDQEMDQAEKLKDDNQISRDKMRKLETFVQWLVDEIRPKYTEIERQLEDWLEQEYPEEYKQTVHDLAVTEISSSPVKKFWKNHVHSYRHARGQALRLAVYQNIGRVLKDDYSIEEIRSEAEKAFEDVKQVNIESLRNMTKVADEEASRIQAESLLEAESPLYSKLFIKTVIEHWSKNGLEKSRREYQPFASLGETWRDIKSDVDEVSEDSKYWKWSNIERVVERNMNKMAFDVEQRYGIKLRNISDEPMVSISKPGNFERFEDLDFTSNSPDSDVADESSEDVNEVEESDFEDSSGVISGSEEDLKIDGDYEVDKHDLLDLFRSNRDKYDGGEIPMGDLKRYFGRKYDGSKMNELDDLLDRMRSNGLLSESSVGKLSLSSSY